MYKIVCLGTMHTFGGQKTEQYPFEKTWPGILSNFLNQSNIENYIYNGGESGFSIQYYPYKILNFYNEYKPDCVIIEVPVMDKIDLEISGAITGEYINKKQDYHPLYSRQRVQTKDWVKGFSYVWPNRTTMSKSEILDAFADSQNISHFKGHITNEYQSFLNELDIGDHERTNVQNKIEKIKSMIPNEAFELMKSYLYFRAMYLDESDTDTISFLNHLNNIIQTCKNLGIKFALFNVNKPVWLNTQIYTETYKNFIGHGVDWINGIEWYMKKDYKIDGDGYFLPSTWQQCIEQSIGPWVKNR